MFGLAALVSLALAAPQMQPEPSQTPSASAPVSVSGRDVVHLQSGGFVRGTIEEYEPGGRVVLRKTDGSTRTFSASEVDRVDVRGVRAQPSPESTLSSSSKPPSLTLGPGLARVHLVSAGRRSGELALLRRTGGVFVSGSAGSASGFSWETICSDPCAKPVDTTAVYFVNGLNQGALTSSKTLSLARYEGRDVTLSVRGGNTGLLVGGVVVMTVGGVAAGMSSLWFINDDYSNVNGGAMLAAGMAGFVGGLVMLLRGRHRVELQAGPPA